MMRYNPFGFSRPSAHDLFYIFHLYTLWFIAWRVRAGTHIL